MAGHLTPVCFGAGKVSGPIDPAATLTAKGQRLDFEVETFAVQAVTGNITHSLNAANNGKGCSEGGTGRGVPTIAFTAKDYGADAQADLSPTLRAGGHASSHANAGVMPAVALPLLEPGARTGKSTTDPRAGIGISENGDPMFTLQAGKQHGVATQTVAFNVHENQRAEVTLSDTSGAMKCAGGKPGQGYPAVMTIHGTQDPIISQHHAHSLGRNSGAENAIFNGLSVRRLMPVECERLQGFPDGHTAIPYRGKSIAADGPRYKAIGNSMAVVVMEWIGRRIEQTETIT